MLRTAIIGWAATSVGASDLVLQEGKCTIDAAGCMLSPNYPNPYPSNEQCSVLTGDDVIALQVADFETEARHDVLMIDGVAYSGSKKPQVVLDQNGGTLLWESNEKATRGGWKICPENPAAAEMWWVTAPCGFCADKCITSPNYPEDYGVNQQCQITYPANFGQVTVHHFDLDLGDTLGGETGGIGSSVPARPKSFIQWFADDSVSKKGWKLCPLKVAPAAAAEAQCPVSTGAPKAPRAEETVESMPEGILPESRAEDAIGEFSMGSVAVTSSRTSALALSAAVAAVAGFVRGWLTFRRRVTSDIAAADHRALALEADCIEAGAESPMIQ